MPKSKRKAKITYIIHRIGDEVVRNPKLGASKEIVDRALKMGHKLAEEEQGLIMGNLLLAKLYLKKGDKEMALQHFNTFFKSNGESEGNNTHPTVTNLKKAIDSM